MVRAKTLNYIEIMKVAAKTGRITTSEVKIANKSVRTVRLYESRQNTMIGVGYYNRGNDPGSADGVLYFKVINDGVTSNIKKPDEIPVEIINQYVTEKEKRKNEEKENGDEAELSYLRLSDVKIQDDGSIVVIGEQAFIERLTQSSKTGASYGDMYYYQDMLVTRIDPNGKLYLDEKTS